MLCRWCGEQGIIRCRARVGGQGKPWGDGKPEVRDVPPENGISGINKSSSDDRPGPGICDSKYVEDAKAARSVRVWDRVPMKNIGLGGLRQASPHGGNLVAAINDIWVQPLDTCDVLELCVCPIIRGSLAIRRGLCRCSASLTSVSQHGCLVFFRCEAVLFATMNLLL